MPSLKLLACIKRRLMWLPKARTFFGLQMSSAVKLCKSAQRRLDSCATSRRRSTAQTLMRRMRQVNIRGKWLDLSSRWRSTTLPCRSTWSMKDTEPCFAAFSLAIQKCPLMENSVLSANGFGKSTRTHRLHPMKKHQRLAKLSERRSHR